MTKGTIELLGDKEAQDALLTKVISGDPDASRIFYTKITPLVRGIIRKHFPDSNTVDDVMQQTFTRIVQNLPQKTPEDFESPNNLKNWISTITANVIKNAIRDTTRHRLSFLGDLAPGHRESPENRVVDRRSGPVEEAIAAELKEHFVEAFKELPDRQRRALRLQMQGNSYQEIGDVMDVNSKGAKSLLARAKSSVRKHLQSAEFEEPSR